MGEMEDWAGLRLDTEPGLLQSVMPLYSRSRNGIKQNSVIGLYNRICLRPGREDSCRAERTGDSDTVSPAGATSTVLHSL